MKAKVLEQSKDKVKLIIDDAQTPMVNAFRRALMSSVPTMAIEDVHFIKNNSGFYDEMIAHRLGLVPLTTDYSYSKISECKCKGEGCSRCQVTFTLEKSGEGYVYASDMKTSDPKVKPVYPEMIIAYLSEDQELSFEAKAQLGTGKEHSKWSAGLAYHRFYPKITIHNNKVEKGSKAVAAACPKDVLDFKDGKLSIKKENFEKCDLCRACVKAASNGEIEVAPDTSKVFFTFESWGQLPAKVAFDKAISVLEDEIKELRK